MIPPHLFYQIYLSFLEQNDCTPPKCGELSEYTDTAHTEVEDLSSRCMNGSNRPSSTSKISFFTIKYFDVNITINKNVLSALLHNVFKSIKKA